jgi:hypothetical protein
MNIILLFLISIQFIASNGYTLNPIADGWGYSAPAWTGTCYGCFFDGTSTTFKVQAFKPPVASPTYYYTGHVKFNLTSATSSCNVQSASLKITSSATYTGTVFTIIRSQTGWTETSICDPVSSSPFYSCAGASTNTADFSGASSTTCTAQSDNTCTSTVTTDVTNAFNNGNSVIAFSIKYFILTSSPYTFYTRESSIGKPELVFTCV